MGLPELGDQGWSPTPATAFLDPSLDFLICKAVPEPALQYCREGSTLCCVQGFHFFQPMLMLIGVHRLVFPCVLVHFCQATSTSGLQWLARVHIYFHARASVGQLWFGSSKLVWAGSGWTSGWI